MPPGIPSMRVPSAGRRGHPTAPPQEVTNGERTNRPSGRIPRLRDSFATRVSEE